MKIEDQMLDYWNLCREVDRLRASNAQLLEAAKQAYEVLERVANGAIIYKPTRIRLKDAIEAASLTPPAES